MFALSCKYPGTFERYVHYDSQVMNVLQSSHIVMLISMSAVNIHFKTKKTLELSDFIFNVHNQIPSCH